MSFYLPIFDLLNKANVSYIVVGGIATILHGYVRATTDIDLVVDLQIDEAKKVIDTFTDAGFQPKIPVNALDFVDENIREQWIVNKGMQVFSLYHPDQISLTIDLFVEYPHPYDELMSRSIIMELGETRIRVCSIDDLITMKRHAGRHKDLDDIEQLTKKNIMKPDEINDSVTDWQVSFKQTRETQLNEMFEATPAQRLIMAEELLTFVIATKSAKISKKNN